MEFLVLLLYISSLIMLFLYIDFGKFERDTNIVFGLIFLYFMYHLPDAIDYFIFDYENIYTFIALTILCIVYGYGFLQKKQPITCAKRYLNGYLLGSIISPVLFLILINMFEYGSLADQLKTAIVTIMCIYIISMLIMIVFRVNFLNKKYTFLVLIVEIGLLLAPVVSDAIDDVVKQRQYIEDNNRIEADQINVESTNFILDNNYEDNQIILTSKLIKPLAIRSYVLQEAQFGYDQFNFTAEDVEYIEGLKGVESVTLRTNLHGLIKNQFTFYDYDQLTTEKQNEYLGYYTQTLESYYPDEGSINTISMDNSEADYNKIEKAVQVVDINNPNPLADSFVKHIYYDYSNVNIIEGEWPQENNQILVPDLLVDAYSLYDNDISIDNVLGKKVTNKTTNEQLEIVGVYDTVDYIGDEYYVEHYTFKLGNTFKSHVIPPIFEYFSDDYLKQVDEILYDITTKINNLYYNEDYMDAERNIIDENYISPFDYEDFKDNEIVITLSPDANVDRITKKISKKYSQHYYVEKSRGIDNVYDMD